MRPCTCDKSTKGDPWIDGQGCRLCWLFHNDLTYHLHWSGKTLPPLTTKEAIKEFADWHTIPEPTQAAPGFIGKMVSFGAAGIKHLTGHQVSRAELEARLTVCAGCDQFDPITANCRKCGCNVPRKASWAETECPLNKWSTPRHLIYHCYPRATSRALWQWHMDELRPKLGLFTGTKRIAVAVDDGTDSLAAVRDYLAADGIDWIERANDPLGETNSFFDSLMPPLEKERGITFYGHTKGTSHAAHELTWVLPWTKRMYDVLLTESAIAATKTAPCVGIFRNRRAFNAGFSDCPWHFPGTFFWFRNDRVFNNPVPWREHDPHRFAVEMYLGYRFGVDEGVCLYGEGQSTI